MFLGNHQGRFSERTVLEYLSVHGTRHRIPTLVRTRVANKFSTVLLEYYRTVLYCSIITAAQLNKLIEYFFKKYRDGAWRAFVF